jgi:hypothetical protein
VAATDPRSSIFTLMRRVDGDPAALITHFCEVTGFKPEEVEAL